METSTNAAPPVPLARLVVPLPCPFCGKTPKMEWHESYGGYKIRVIYCHAKKCHIKPSVRVAKLVGMKDADARAHALSRWNYRHNVNILP